MFCAKLNKKDVEVGEVHAIGFLILRHVISMIWNGEVRNFANKKRNEVK